MSSDKDQVLQEIADRSDSLSTAEIELNNISGYTYDQVDTFVENNTSDPGLRIILKLFGRVILAMVKVLKIKIYKS